MRANPERAQIPPLLCSDMVEAMKRFYADDANIRNFEAWKRRNREHDRNETDNRRITCPA